MAQGETVVGKLVHLDGVTTVSMKKLAQLGAKIQQIEANDENKKLTLCTPSFVDFYRILLGFLALGMA